MSEKGGYYYYASDEKLEAFARLTLLERLKWIDELRLFTLMASTPETTERRERLRRGETIIGDQQFVEKARKTSEPVIPAHAGIQHIFE